MADYIDDSGSYGQDALLSGTYTKDAANKTLTMGATGSADTDFTLPSSTAWMLVETYDLEGVAGDIGYTRYQTDVSQINTDLAAYQDIVEAEYTTYKMKATYFDGTDAHIYEGDETTDFPTTADYTKTSWTPPTGTWKITDTLVAPDNVSYGSELIVNGDFSSGLTPAWYNAIGETVVTGNQLQFGDGTSGFNGVGQIISTFTVGDTYKFSIDIVSVTGTYTADEYFVSFTDSDDPSNKFSTVNVLDEQVDGAKTIEVVFNIPSLENGATKWDSIEIWDGWDTGGYEYSVIDNVSLKKQL